MEELLTRLTEKVEGRYFGKYRGFVVSNEDEQHLGRLQLKVPSVLGDQVSAWALPCLPFAGPCLPSEKLGTYGFFAVPEKGAQVWVEFEEGEIDHPIWTGTFWRVEDDVPEGARLKPPTTRLLQTPSGHRLQFDDKSGKERVVLHHHGGAELAIDAKGSISLAALGNRRVLLDADAGQVVIEDGNRNRVVLASDGITVEDANGNKIQITASGVKVKASRVVLQASQVALGDEAGEPALKGASFLAAFAQHVHLSATAGSPTSPPVPLPTLPQTLSNAVLVK